MLRLKTHSETRSVSSHYTDITITSTCHGVVLDVQTCTAGLDSGDICRSALARLSIEDARELRDALTKTLDAAENLVDPRQSALWSANVAGIA